MIFNCRLSEDKKVRTFIESATEHDENDTGFIFKSYYDEEVNEIILNNLYFDENNIIHEENIDQTDLGIKIRKKQTNPRYVMITCGSKARHGGRMKVSANGKRINQNNKSNYISIHNSGKDIEVIGNPKDIDMNNKELQIYKDLYARNSELIQFICEHPEYEQYADNAIINDEKLRVDGYTVNRNRDTGYIKVYDKNNNIVKSGNIWEAI